MPIHRRRWLLLTSCLLLLQIVSILRVLQIPDTVGHSLVIPLEVMAGVMWTIMMFIAIIMLNRHKAYAIRYTMAAIGGFMLYRLLRLFLFVRADYDRQRLPFLLTIAVAITMSLTLKWVRSHWASGDNRKYGLKSQN